jgi:hypothetical protein
LGFARERAAGVPLGERVHAEAQREEEDAKRNFGAREWSVGVPLDGNNTADGAEYADDRGRPLGCRCEGVEPPMTPMKFLRVFLLQFGVLGAFVLFGGSLLLLCFPVNLRNPTRGGLPAMEICVCFLPSTGNRFLHQSSGRSTVLITRAGLPTATERGGTFFVTTEPAPTMECRPTVTGPRIFAPAPIVTWLSTVG